jgi:hypothetical protein
MAISPLKLLANRDAFWAEAKNHRFGWLDLLPFLAFIVLACGLYGAILAGWRSPRLSFYVAIKLPLLFLATVTLVSLFNWMLASFLGAGLDFKLTIFCVVAAMTITSWILLSLTPVALFFVLSGVPSGGTDDELHYAHNCILVTHISVLAIAGVAGYSALLSGLRKLVRPQCSIALLFFAWVATTAFVGCQMAWILRPFVGSPFYPVAFMRPDCLDRNFYEFVFTEVLPYIVTGGN